MTTTHCILLLALGLALSACVGARAESFAIVDGSARAVVAIPSRPSEAEKLAASEIANYVESISGAKLEIVATDEPPMGSLVLGRGAGLAEEGYSIETKDGRLLLTGARDHSVLYAAYDLLGRLGCKWLAPKYAFYGDSAEVVPKKDRLVLQLDKPVSQTPKLKFRKLYVEEGHSHNAQNLLQIIEWMSKTRRNTLVVPTDYQGAGRVKWDNWREALTPELRKRDITIEVGGHGYQNFINAEMPEVKAHSEWLGMDAQGKRRTEHGFVFCSSNAAAVDFLVNNVVGYLEARPEIDIFDFWPPDGSKWCECEACRKLGTPADRQSRLVAEVIRKAREQGVTARFECIAYAVYTQPPTSPPMNQSVLIDFCPIGQCFEVQINDLSSPKNAEYAAAVQAWRKSLRGDLSIYSYYRKYAWDSLPVIIPHYMQADMKWYAKIGADGISSYSEPGDWRTYELNHYVLSRLSWDPDCDVDAIISEFCESRFPKCADAARALLMALEDTVRHGCRIPGTTLKPPTELTGYMEKLTKAKSTLAQQAASDPAVAALVTATEFALKDMAIQKQRAEQGSLDDRVKMVDELSAFLESHDGQGVFVLGGRLSKDKLMKAYGAVAGK